MPGVTRFADPKLPEGVDLVFVSNTYHHIEDRAAYFQGVKRYLNPGGRVAILEYTSDGLLQSCGHSTDAGSIRSEMESAGYSLDHLGDMRRLQMSAGLTQGIQRREQRRYQRHRGIAQFVAVFAHCATITVFDKVGVWFQPSGGKT